MTFDLGAGVKWTEVAQVAVLLVTGAFGIWRWGLSEQRRKKQEIPTLDGTFVCSEKLEQGDQCFVSLVSTWRNRGVLPVYASPSASQLIVHDVTDQEARPTGEYLDLEDEHAPPAVEHRPLAGYAWYMFEPDTDSQLVLPLILPKARVWLAEIRICLDESRYRGKKGQVLLFTRKLLFQT